MKSSDDHLQNKSHSQDAIMLKRSFHDYDLVYIQK